MEDDFLGGWGPSFLKYAIWVVDRVAYINIKMGYGLNRNPLYYMEPADRIELSTY